MAEEVKVLPDMNRFLLPEIEVIITENLHFLRPTVEPQEFVIAPGRDKANVIVPSSNTVLTSLDSFSVVPQVNLLHFLHFQGP